MVTLRNEKIIRKPHNVFINPDALHEARVEALRARKSLGQWIEELIKEKIEREQKTSNRKDLLPQVFLENECQ